MRFLRWWSHAGDRLDRLRAVRVVSAVWLCPETNESFSLLRSVIFSPAPEVTVNDDCTTITGGLGTRATVFIPPLVGCNFVLGL